MMHPDTELHRTQSGVGLGVFATAPIKRGTLVYVKDSLDVVVPPSAYERLDPARRARVERYSYVDSAGIRVLSWDLAKYVNHSCAANSMSTAWGFEIAVKDIHAGEEITDEYGLLNMSASMECTCAASNCRRVVSARDLAAQHTFWDELVQAALSFTRSIPQPLWGLLDAKQSREIDSYLEGKIPYRSVQVLRVADRVPARPHSLDLSR